MEKSARPTGHPGVSYSKVSFPKAMEPSQGSQVLPASGLLAWNIHVGARSGGGVQMREAAAGEVGPGPECIASFIHAFETDNL